MIGVGSDSEPAGGAFTLTARASRSFGLWRTTWCWADTGMETVPPSPATGIDPAGRIRLLAASTPWIWLIETLFAAILAGSSLTTRRY